MSDSEKAGKASNGAPGTTDAGLGADGDHLVVDIPETPLPHSVSQADLFAEKQKGAKKDSILKRLMPGTEGTTVLVGSLASITEPVVAFVRLAQGIIMPSALEVPVPVRFVFVLLTPKPSPNLDCKEVGRAFSTLMSNPSFHNVCYRVEERADVLTAINEFLDESVVLPPVDYSTGRTLDLLDVGEIRNLATRRRRAHTQASMRKKLDKVPEGKSPLVSDDEEEEKKDDKEKRDDEKEKKKPDPFRRTRVPFGGIWNDIKKRYPHYLSDFKDGLNGQALSATVFIYFACLSGAIAFGGLLGEKTRGLIGIPETIIVSCVAGLLFALFSGTPLIITGVTGPVLLYDEALFQFSDGKLPFLPWRVWIGFWTLIIALVVSAFQGSTLVKFFTKFTKDIFNALVALLFIFEAINKLAKIFKKHPLQSLNTTCKINETLTGLNESWSSETEFQSELQRILNEQQGSEEEVAEPNTALLSAILMFGTFFIAYFLRIFRNGKYLGRTVRRALGDFGVPLAIVCMVLLDFLIQDTFTEKLAVPDGLQVTDPAQRNWTISPFGSLNNTISSATGMPEGVWTPLQVWAMFAAFIPAILLYSLLFMETHICELIMMDRSNAKGNGLHLDIVLLSLINFLGSIFGGPWICAATVRAVSHVSALTVMSTTHAPGEAPHVVEVKDQRLSATLVSIILGLSVLLSPILKQVPFAVLFGVFLYMGVSSMTGVQLFDRIHLLFMPVKHHPQLSYIVGLGVLWAVKSSPAALAFPFFVIAMIPFRMSLRFLFTPMELEALDGPNAGQVVRDDEPDFYAAGAGIG